MNKEIRAYNSARSHSDREICNKLAQEIDSNLPEAENKIWHAHPVWFLNVITSYSIHYTKLYEVFQTETGTVTFHRPILNRVRLSRTVHLPA